MAFALAVLVLLSLAVGLLLAYTIRTGISPVPTTPRVAEAVLALARDAPPGAIHELGSGWGNLAVALARRFPDRPVIAHELSPLPWLASRLWQRAFPRPNLAIRREDFFGTPLEGAGLVVCYLYPGAMRRLAPKLERELAEGALVVSNSFAVPGWTPRTVARAADAYATKVYLYRMPPAPVDKRARRHGSEI